MVFSLGIITASAATASWKTVGGSGFSAGAANYESLYVYKGTPYVAYEDRGNSDKVTVMKYNGSAWEPVGSVGFSAGEAYYTSLYVYGTSLVTDSGTPYVAYMDLYHDHKATVMKYNGSSWETVGSAGFSAGQAAYISLYVYDGTPYVAYMDSENLGKATVMKYNGSSWESVGNVAFSANPAYYTSLYVDDGTPYVAYRDTDSSKKATVMKYNGSAWVNVGSASFSAGQADYTSLYVYNHTPYVAYADYSNGKRVTVMKLNGSTSIWESVGAPGFSAGQAEYTSLYVDNGTPYVAYKDYDNDMKATVKKYNGSSWETVGGAGFSDSYANNTSLFVYDGTPYVAYADANISNRATVMALINSYTVTFNSNGGSSVSSVTQDSGTTIATAPAPTKTGYELEGCYSNEALTSAVSFPYTITADVTLNAKWTAKPFTVTFSTDGGDALTPVTQDYGTTITSSPTPTKSGYTFEGWYSDSALTSAVSFPYTISGDVTLYAKFKTWKDVGSPGFSALQADHTSLFVYNGTPYVAYGDASNSDKATVMKYNGSAWEPVGDLGFSAGEVGYTSLYVYNGTPYVAYQDGANSYKATVMKYNGSAWETVGSAGFSDSYVYDTSLYVDNGTPYVAYQDWGGGDHVFSKKATVKKFDGSAWVNVGEARFSAGEANYTSLSVDGGTPYVAYRDSFNSNGATVMKYNGSAWVNVGAPGFSAGQADYTSLYVYNGTPYVAYNDGVEGGKATVMKYNGSAWETVGDTGFSAGAVNYPSLYVYDGTPYVAYDNADGDFKATVMKYNGSAWANVGSTGFSAGGAYYTSLYVYGGTPYVAYVDGYNDNKATVMRYLGDSCTITFDSDGGSAVDSVTQDSGTTIATSPTPTKTGSTFAGWYSDSSLTSAVSFPYTISGAVTLHAKWTAVTSSSNDIPMSSRTITVTDTSSSLFSGSSGQFKAEANMTSAFSDSVEVKVTDTTTSASDFGLGVGNTVYPFDISLYLKGTNIKTKPNNGYAVTLYLPLPAKLLDMKNQLSIVHRSDDGTVTTLTSQLKQIDNVWYLVFETTEFSPYALVANNIGNYDETAGLPYYVDSAGNTVYIGFAAGGKYIAPPDVTVLVRRANIASFTDTSSHWAMQSITFVTERALFNGTGDNLFSPNEGMTRAMFATVIGRLYERSYGAILASSAHAFTDCDYTAYYGKYVDWAAEKGIISGYGNDAFGPNDYVTREQMATILYRFTKFIGELPIDTGATLSYPDAGAISGWATNAALYCQRTGIITGRDGGSFVPLGLAKRAEVAVILERFIRIILS